MSRATTFWRACFQEGHSFLFSDGVAGVFSGKMEGAEFENFQQRVFSADTDTC
jgi:hypothetical protein